MIPNKKQTLEILNKYIKEKPNLEHSLMVGYGLLGLAKYLEKDETEQNYWLVVGCLHDIDLEEFGGDINQHCLVGENILQKEDIDQNIINDIKSHNDALNIDRSTQIQHALYSTDGLTGIIRAYVLMRPDKDIKQAKVKSIKKKIKDKTFAAAVNRDQIKLCETKLNIDLSNFIEAILVEIQNNMDFT